MRLNGVHSSVYFSFENVGQMAVFGIAFPDTESSDIRQRLAAADVSGHREQSRPIARDRLDARGTPRENPPVDR